jgi:hypothetical protein
MHCDDNQTSEASANGVQKVGGEKGHGTGNISHNIYTHSVDIIRLSIVLSTSPEDFLSQFECHTSQKP